MIDFDKEDEQVMLGLIKGLKHPKGKPTAIEEALVCHKVRQNTSSPKSNRSAMPRLDASDAYYIKLGRGGSWETECLRDSVLRLGYRESPHDLCVAGDWAAVRTAMKQIKEHAGAATQAVAQLRAFYEAGEHAVFVTFVDGYMYWCRACGSVELLPDRSRLRRTLDGWHNTSVGGVTLTSDRVSGHLLKVQMFQGTICEIKAKDYLLRKLNDELSPEVAAAKDAERALISAIIGLLRLLTWQDFELLVDLVFSTSGWRRVGVVGRTQKNVDIEMILPTTGERAFVQVKSQARPSDAADYVRLTEGGPYHRMFFVWHTGNVSEIDSREAVTLVGPERFAQMIVDAGLSSWLREKAS
jgi:hypothetical protein